ncbi:hypothetical protein AB395_00003177 [Sinorhizobium fredii CCBAU 45436]|nr:hypothetical protein AB395_00003177 [Sinorhizobium fredii CCBAU 45436]
MLYARKRLSLQGAQPQIMEEILPNIAENFAVLKLYYATEPFSSLWFQTGLLLALRQSQSIVWPANSAMVSPKRPPRARQIG